MNSLIRLYSRVKNIKTGHNHHLHKNHLVQSCAVHIVTAIYKPEL